MMDLFVLSETIKWRILWFPICVLSTHYPTQPTISFCRHEAYHCDYPQIIYMCSGEQRVLHTGRCTALLLIFNIPPFDPHGPWAHSMLTSLSCCNCSLLKQAHQSICPYNCVRGSHDYLFGVRIWIDSLSINSCWLTSMLLRQCTDIYDYLKHTNQPSQHTESIVHKHFISSTPQWFCHPSHQWHGWCPPSCLILWISQLFWPILTLN